jgi:hypothetical protein
VQLNNQTTEPHFSHAKEELVIYINQLPKLFDQTNSDPFIRPNGTTVSSILYADDLVIISRSCYGLQNSQNQLHSWSKKWLMEINMRKSKIMIFQKHTMKQPNINFSIGTNSVANTNE